MKAHLKIEGAVLSLWLYDVDDTPDANIRTVRVEMELLKKYGNHRADPVRYSESGKAIYGFHRGDSNHKTLENALQVLAGFCLNNEPREDWVNATRVVW